MQTAVLRSAAPCAVLNSSRRSATTRAFAPARRVAVSRRGAVSCRAHCGVSFFFLKKKRRKKKESKSLMIWIESAPVLRAKDSSI